MHTAQSPYTYLPLTAYVTAGPASAPPDDHLWESPVYPVLTRSLRRGDSNLLMQVVGHSMDNGTERSIPHGSLVLVDQADLRFHHMRRGYVYVFVSPTGAAVAKIYDLYRGRPALISLNPEFQPIQDFRRDGYEPVGLLYGVRETADKVRSVGAY